MIVVYGWGKRTDKDLGATYPLTCKGCERKIFINLVKVTTWLHIFFVPIIPYKSTYIMRCGFCETGFELRGDAVKRAKEINLITKRYLNKELSKVEYDACVQRIDFNVSECGICG